MDSALVRFYEAIIRIGTGLQSYVLLLMRLYWGYQFFQTGMGKFSNIENIIQYFQGLGIPFAAANAYLVSSLEVVGGLCLLFGLGARLLSVPLIAILLTAYLTAHHEAVVHLFDNPENFISQAPFNYLLTCVIVFCFGPGKISLDQLIGKKRE